MKRPDLQKFVNYEQLYCLFKDVPNPYVGFAVDDTGSMYNEIGSVQNWISACLNGVPGVCSNPALISWLFVTFNDPGKRNLLFINSDNFKGLKTNFFNHSLKIMIHGQFKIVLADFLLSGFGNL